MDAEDPGANSTVAGTADDRGIRYARLHHVNFLTTRLAEMRDWYGTVLGMEVNFELPVAALLSNDRANHRIALFALPGLKPDPDKRDHDRIHHAAYEFASFDDLNDTYLRLRAKGIEPKACLDHGMTFSYYYCDPDGNYVELQCDVFGDWDKSTLWTREQLARSPNPIGVFVDPAKVAEAAAAGANFAEIHRRAWETDDFTCDELPDLGWPTGR